jgi:two-component system NarL family sensor kinase
MPEPACLSDALIEQSTHCSWVLTAEGEFLRVSGDPRPIFRKPASELVGRAMAEALDAGLAGEWKDRLERILAGETMMLRLRHQACDWAIVIFPVRFQNRVYGGGSAVEITSWNAAEQELRHTVLGALKAQEFERRMVSKFLHDRVGQNLTALGLQLDLVRMDLETVSPETSARVVDIQRILEGMMEEVREYSYELNPSAVERAGLRSALDRLAARVRGRFTGALRVNVDPSLNLDPGVASAMYQIAQEAVENALQHSSCSAIEIAVKSTRTGPAMEIRDNGKGFDPADIAGGRRGLGLLSMEHHAAQAGLDLSIRSSRGNGAAVRAAAPEA